MFKTALALLLLSTPLAFAHNLDPSPDLQWGAVKAKDKFVRSQLVNEGFSIENIKDDMAYGFGTPEIMEKLKKAGFEVTSQLAASEIHALDFPSNDAIYHNYEEVNQELDALVAANPGVVHKFTIGKSLEGREIFGVRISPHAKDGLTPSGLPGIVFMGGHHAREHLSVEIPLLLAKFLTEDRSETTQRLVDTRDIFIIPTVNPDGKTYDIASGSYRMWRKNRNLGTNNACPGVDLNRNYGYKWGTGGSSTNPCSDVYMGKAAFSEPETQAVKNFVETHPNLKVLLTLHTFSELILYPWGYTYDGISNQADQATFDKMARTMAGWNHYTPEQSSDLYITSGDTVDWAYGTLGIFAFTFELSPANSWGGGGFYPGPNEIQSTFQENLRPALYLIDLADDPHRAASAPQTTLFYGQ